MFSTSDTIVAIATPPGRGGIGVVRLSGPDAQPIACALVGRRTKFPPRHATLATIGSVDHAVITAFPAPASYTGEDVVEVSLHGSPVILRAIVAAAMTEGARLAEPGEFTLRAYLNGRIDLPQAEAVADLVDAVTPLQARAAFDQLQGTLSRAIGQIEAALFDLVAKLEASVDFPEEGYHFIDRADLVEELGALLTRIDALVAGARRGRLVREGLQVAIIGKPNVGKSSLFNALVGAARAIVTPMPGTTRDLVTEIVELDGLCATMVDTAGLRATADDIEAEGVSRARGARQVASLVLVVLDSSQALDEEDRLVLREARGSRHVIVANKTDLQRVWTPTEVARLGGPPRDAAAGPVHVSAATGDGLDELRAVIAGALDFEPAGDCPMMTNVRHVALVQRAREALDRARSAAAGDAALPEEFVLADLQEARAALEEVSGRRAPDAVLAHIFERFCIGK